MRQCDRCSRWYHESNSAVCNPCWADMGQMALEFDEDDEYMPTIDSVFDRMAEQEGRFP